MNTYKIIGTPRIGVRHATSQAFGVGISELSCGSRAREPRLKIGIGIEQSGKLDTDGINYILLAQTVALSSCVGIFGIVTLVNEYFYSHEQHSLINKIYYILFVVCTIISTKRKEVSIALKDSEKNKIMGGTLYLVATPIGNLADLSQRAIKTLNEVDFIAAEDTRNTLRLLTSLGISSTLVSYHEHNKASAGQRILERLLAGESCALVTDAGTPAISDPGEDLVVLCAENGVPITAVPGACACIDALTLSGLDTRRFVFEGFLPVKGRERRERLCVLSRESRTFILHEAPHKLRATLTDLCESLGGERRIALCRELTKLNEEIMRTTLASAVEHYERHEPRGEYVLVVEGASDSTDVQDGEKMTPVEAVKRFEAEGMSRSDAIKAAAKLTGMSRNEVYAAVLEAKEK